MKDFKKLLVVCIVVACFGGLAASPAAAQEIGACCLSDGSCVMTDQEDCEMMLMGDWKGDGTGCLGDGNANGIDDACEDLEPKEDSFNVMVINSTYPGGVYGGGTGYNYGEWYYYENTGWWNIWFYDHPFDWDRKKVIHVSFQLIPIQVPSYAYVVYNWSRPPWSPNPGQPPLPPLTTAEETQYIMRSSEWYEPKVLYHGDLYMPIFIEDDFEIPDYNPEWLSIDVMGYGFEIVGGYVFHDCVPEDGETEACCYPDGLCEDLSEEDCLMYGGTPQGEGTDCATTTCPTTEPDEACCLDDGDCYDVDPIECTDMLGGTPHGPGTVCLGDGNGNGIDDACEEMPEEPSEPFLRVGDYMNPEPWHNWVSAHEVTHVQLHVFDPCETIHQVNFYYSLNGTYWERFYSDYDGYESTEDTNETPGTLDGGDGWSGYLPPETIPTEMCEMVLFRAEGLYNVDSFFDVYTERMYDYTPPSSVSINVEDFDEVEEDVLYIDVDPCLADIYMVYYDIEPKPNEFKKGIPKVKQEKVGRAYGGKYHCAPTAAAACLKYFENQGDPNICGGLNADDLVDALAKLAKTNQNGTGTYPKDLANAIRKWIQDNGDGYTVRGPLNHFDWKEVRDELEKCQDILLGIHWTGCKRHRMTLNSVVNKPLPSGKIKIDFMDPWTGEYQYGELDPYSGEMDNFDSTSGDQGTLEKPIIICPKEDDSSGGGGGGGQQPGPDPGPIPLPVPDPGFYRVTITVVDTCNNAATLTRIVERVEREYGDAPEGVNAVAYPSTGVTGSFPTCITVGPAGWVQNCTPTLVWFGLRADLETDGDASLCPNCFPTYDDDECFADGDAGIMFPEPYTIDTTGTVVPCPQGNGTSLGNTCQWATWGIDIDIDVTNTFLPYYDLAFVNVLVDWNRSGEWSGASMCNFPGDAPEYVLIDFPVPANYSGPLSALMSAGSGFLIGPEKGYVWVRFMISHLPVNDPDWDGSGDFFYGEVEDYLLYVGEEIQEPKPPVEHLKWSQPPIEINPMSRTPVYCGWDEPSWTQDLGFIHQKVADDFRCLGNMPVTSIHWWGSHIGWDEPEPPLEQPIRWLIEFWTNVPAGAVVDFSRPEKLLWQIVVDADRVDVNNVGRDYFPDPDILPETCFQYYVDLEPEEYFWQSEFDVDTIDSVFWLSIVAIYPKDIDVINPWGWKTRPWSWMDDAVRRLDILPDLWVWEPIEGDIGGLTESYDVAFELDTDPNYIKWEQPFTGIRHWPHYEDELSMATEDLNGDIIFDSNIVADDWRCDTNTPVTAVVWWGSYIGYEYEACYPRPAAPPVKPDYFLLQIWTDTPAGTPGTHPYSHPNDIVWEYRAYDYDEVLVGYDKHPLGGPPLEPVFRYSVRLPEGVPPEGAWFCQEDVNDIYWLSVVAVYKRGNDPPYPWGWTNHAHNYNDDAVSGYLDYFGAAPVWIWKELYDQTGITEDMSFVLFTEPGCFPCCHPDYFEWLSVGKPDCWCYPRQCHGDADGLKEGSKIAGYFYVGFGDLAIMLNGWKVKEPPKGPGIASIPNGICCDFAHDIEGSKIAGYFRVGFSDLAIMLNGWKVKEPPKGPGIDPNCLDCP